MNTPERGSLCAANEILEKTLLAELRLPYLHAHQIAPPFIAVATAFLSSDQSRALARRPTCCIPQPSSVMPSVPLRAGGLGPSDGNHAQAAAQLRPYYSKPSPLRGFFAPENRLVASKCCAAKSQDALARAARASDRPDA